MATRDDLASLNPDLAATLGLYEMHRFCIRLGPLVSLLTEEDTPKGELDVDVLVVLLHEYTHFLHNLSTVSGFAAYQCFQQLLGVFSNALNDDGSCDPAKLLQEHRDTARSALDTLESINGSQYPPSHPSPVTGLAVTSADCEPTQVGGATVQRAAVVWSIRRRDGTLQSFVGDVGAFIIEEGIAYTLEECVRLRRITFDRSGACPAPLYPYEAFRILAQYYVPDISALSAIRLGLLALSTNRPGATLLHVLAAYKQSRANGEDDATACRTVRSSIEETIGAITQRICSSDLREISKMHLERGLVTDGHASVLQNFCRLLTQRASDPWFDVAWCHEDGSLDLKELSTLLLSTVPCDTIQKRWGDDDMFGRDVLLTFQSGSIEQHEEGVVPTAANSGIRAVQAQFDFLLAHLSMANGIVASPRPSPRPCPYYTSCTLEMRRNDPRTCREAPWARMTRKGDTCWYGVAVGATLGTVRNG